MKSAADDLQNVTLSLPRQTLREARKMAVDRNTSLSRLVTGLIEELVAAEDRYRQAQERHLALLASAATSALRAADRQAERSCTSATRLEPNVSHLSS